MTNNRLRFEIYRGGREGNQQWFWRARRKRGGKIIADGAEGYYKLGNAQRAVRAFIDAVHFDAQLLNVGSEIVVLD